MHNHRTKKNLLKQTAKLEKELAARNRQLEIEKALDKVRRRTMAMQRSEELQETTLVLFQQFKSLKVTASQVSICVFDEDTKMGEMFVTLNGEKIDRSFPMELDKEVFVMKKAKKAFLERHKRFSFTIKGKELQNYNHWRNEFIGKKGWDESIAVRKQSWHVNGVFFSRGLMGFSSDTPAPPEALNLLDRFASLFDLTFTRFLDLQKAEAQTREAKVEAALERVRTSSMAMHQSNELHKVIKEVTEQLSQLGFDFDALNITTDLTSAGFYLWNASPATPISSGVYVPYKDIDVINSIYLDWGTHEGIRTGTFNKAQKNAFFKHYFIHTEGKKIAAERKKYILDAKAFNFSAVCRKEFALDVINYRDIIYTSEQNKVLERFANVFEQSYTRFLDLQKAEAQEREVQIELGLERVRARAMVMQNSNELSELVAILFDELVKLDLVLARCIIWIFDSETLSAKVWMANSEDKKAADSYHIKRLDHPYYQAIIKAWKEKKTKWVYELTGKNKRSIDELLLNETELSRLPGAVKSGIRSSSNTIVSASFNNFGFIEASGPLAHTEEQLEILDRFGKVFDLSYTRFNDLQKAEAQAREAQIEAGLERVRSRAMAMQTSEELNALIGTMFSELTKLDLVLTRSVIIIYDAETKGARWWMANSEVPSTPMNFFVAYTDLSFFNVYLKGWEERNLKWQYILEGENKIATDDFLFKETELSLLPDFVIAGMKAPGKVYLNASFNNFGNLTLASLEPLSDEHFDILLRFAKVFDLTYTRFNDLKQAEAQAKESQIQLALERVRARTMAMRKSDELRETVLVIYEQLQHLNFNAQACNIIIADKISGDREFWVAGFTEKLYPESYRVPYIKHPYVDTELNAWKQGHKYATFEYAGKMKHDFDAIFFSQTDFKNAPSEAKKMMKSLESVKFSIAFFLYGSVQVLGPAFLSEENANILQRFANVFEQTYTRFLDLQKAEAQARETQIQLALERVRARTMAMHNSDDISSTTTVVFAELKKLGINSIRCGICLLFKESFDANVYAAAFSNDGRLATLQRTIKMSDHPVLMKQYESWVKQENCINELKGEELRSYYKLPFFQSSLNYNPPVDHGQCEWGYYIPFSEGLFYAWNDKTYSDEELRILERLKINIALTFRRFLDLQKAEAQAREAQIEAALERVRAKTMAMHKSQDLLEVITVLSEQFQVLGFKIHSANFNTRYRERDWELWLYNPGAPVYPEQLHIPYFDHPYFNRTIEALANGSDFHAFVFTKKEKDAFLDHIYANTIARNTPEARKRFSYDAPGFAWSTVYLKNTALTIANYDAEPYTEEQNAIIRRFGNVFEQTYTRFLDLQKAEANAKEAQIEASLERVRSKTMAMHNSNDVGETVATMFAEFVHLGIHTNRCGILILNDQQTAEVWTARSTPEGNTRLIIGKLDLDAHKLLRSVHNAWNTKETFYQYDLLGEDIVQYYSAINNSKFYPTEFDLNALPSKEYHSDFFFADGAVFSFTSGPLAEEDSKIMKRFAGVFGQTYRRYLDLQKAEAQAREAQIETALERVRSRTMAMHQTSELQEVIHALHNELLNLKLSIYGGSFVVINSNVGPDLNCWGSGGTASTAEEVRVPHFNMPFCTNLVNAIKSGPGFFTEEFSQKEKEEFFTKLFKTKPWADLSNEQKEATLSSSGGYTRSVAVSKHTTVFIINHHGRRFTEDENDILKRFAKVFEQTYTRFLDLQKAEAQAKEARIEAGLERVRARTMAMHSSDDVSVATATMFSELEKLGIENFRGGITNMHPNRTQDVWSVNSLAEGQVVKAVGAFNMDDHPFWQLMYKAWQKKNDFTHYFLAGQEKDDYIKILNSTQGYLTRAIDNFPDVHFQVYFFNEGGIWTNSLRAHSDEEQQIMKRFTSVFSLTFRRYQDLKRAEAQAREATIEAALEKVRGKAMAMHNSNDLSVTASMVFTELRKLGINPIRCGVGLLNKESRKAQLYSATSSVDGDSLSLVGWVILSEHPVLEKIYDTWMNNEEYYPELQGEQMKSYYEQLLKGLPVTAPNTEADKKQYGHFIPFSVGCLYAWSETSYSDAELKILRRFATIIDLTFRRYIELQQSETNAREAVKQAALDRIRADIASMRTITDLDRITPLIWNELTILGLPFIRCGVFIMDDAQELIHTFLSTPEGKAIAAFHLPYSTPGNIKKVISHWQDDKNYIDHWNESDFTQFAEILVRQNALASAEAYLKTIPHGGFYLHFLPFLQGMLYVGNTTQLRQEEIELIQHVANAFSTAYARYEDFNKLEAAKQQVEKTLTDLKQAQTQLVQSEKMASLGELTAGIAHEIQNPLNFVNNFSDVSNELLDEMKEELAKGNVGDALAIAEDVKQNLEKINHHGKRADGIVKGMLQHSRTSSGQKELTDINSLADEYLRLAYHGLRAKDKSFNARFITEFDDGVGKINIIQQDFGRVILNLINNAFYAVSEKKKQSDNGYEPSVTITTKSIQPPLGRPGIQIKVTDNGDGIPQKILDKIFQPFFTTKPTGQGTGLGLSLAYDIIKAHGGDIRVETKEGEGSEFIIQLPI